MKKTIKELENLLKDKFEEKNEINQNLEVKLNSKNDENQAMIFENKRIKNEIIKKNEDVKNLNENLENLNELLSKKNEKIYKLERNIICLQEKKNSIIVY